MFNKIKKLLSGERIKEPLHLILFTIFVKIFGSTRKKIAFDLIQRKPYAYGILKSADYALEQGIDTISIIEFGVAYGGGLLNLIKNAKLVTEETGIKFKIYGFDTGQGMTPPIDYRDHPNIWYEGDFPMEFEKLSAALPENASLVLGDVKETVEDFIKNLPLSEPLGFISVDLDYYSSTKNAFKILLGSPEKYLPITVMYFDDIDLDWNNQWCGEFLAINEFNQENSLRKIEKHRFLEYPRVFSNASWLNNIYLLHVLDHPIRNTIKSSEKKKTIQNPYLEFNGNITDLHE